MNDVSTHFCGVCCREKSVLTRQQENGLPKARSSRQVSTEKRGIFYTQKSLLSTTVCRKKAGFSSPGTSIGGTNSRTGVDSFFCCFINSCSIGPSGMLSGTDLNFSNKYAGSIVDYLYHRTAGRTTGKWFAS